MASTAPEAQATAPPAPMAGMPAMAPMADMPGMRAAIAAGREAAARLWERLGEESAGGRPFATPEWMGSWWEAFGDGSGLRVLAVTDGAGRPRALLPLAPGRERLCGIEVARLGPPWNEHTPRFELPCSGHEEECLRAAWERLLDEPWDVLRLPQLPVDGAAGRILGELAAAAGFAVGRWAGSRSPYLPLGGGFERWAAGLSPKFRWRLRNVLRRAEGRGKVDFEIVDGGAGLEAALDEGFALEAAAWKGAAGSAIRSDARVESFYRRLAARLAPRQGLELHFLRSGGRRIAFAYCLRSAGRLYCLKGGYDPAWADCSPCHLLLWFALRSAFARRLDEYDFLGDAEPWKREWTRHVRAHEWLFVFRPALRARLLHLLKFRVAPLLRALSGSLDRRPGARPIHVAA
jgi:CelD/BcsL family acetyltransferase involved in cellulose biosynthesis